MDEVYLPWGIWASFTRNQEGTRQGDQVSIIGTWRSEMFFDNGMAMPLHIFLHNELPPLVIHWEGNKQDVI